MIKKNYINVYLRLLIFFIGLYVTVSIVYSPLNLPNAFFLIPLTYSILILSFSNFTNYIFQNIGLLALNISMFLRYLVSPLLISFEGLSYTGSIVPFNESYNIAVNLMLYELIVIFLAFQLLHKRFYSKKINSNPSLTPETNYVGWIFVLFCLLLILIYPDILSRYSFILFADELKGKDIGIDVISSIPLFVQLGSLILTISLINVFYKKNLKTNRFGYVLLSIATVFILSSFIIGTSRNSVIIPLVTGLYIIYIVFGRYKKIISTISAFAIGFVVVLTTYLKESTINTGESTLKEFVSDLNTDLQLYFSGINNVAIAVETSSIYPSFNIGSILDDITRSVVLLNSLFHSEKSALTDFNITFYNGGLARDQILPMIGQGYLYFGFILAPIFTLIILLLVMYFDSKIIKKDSLFLRYIYAYATLKIGLFMMSNFTILLSFLTNNFLILLILVVLNRKLTSSRGAT